MMFAKTLSANDVGTTGSHQAGICVPKSDPQLLSFFPQLDPAQTNPDDWITAVDDQGREWRFRYIYYNNRLHSDTGTRNEYRLTHLRGYLASVGAKPGDILIFARGARTDQYRISLEPRATPSVPKVAGVITLRGWRRVH